MQKCRDCHTDVSEQAFMCPKCGCPYPAKAQWDGWGFEYKSETTIGNWPLVHVAFKYRPNRTPVIAKGIVAVGQFAVGIITVAQFGIGLICVAQFAIAGYALAQFAAAYSLVAQFGLYLHSAKGMLVFNLLNLVR